jgi:hypothetical protein
MKSPTSSATRRPTRGKPRTNAALVTQLHPLIRRHLGVVDLRRTRILRVEDGLAVDVIVRNAQSTTTPLQRVRSD